MLRFKLFHKQRSFCDYLLIYHIKNWPAVWPFFIIKDTIKGIP